MKRSVITRLFFLSVFCVLFTSNGNTAPVTLGIIPFSVQPDTSRSVLEPALIELFSSRLALKNSVDVIDKSRTITAYNNNETDPLERLLETGRNTGADYLLTGSVIETGAGYVLSAYVLDVSSGKAVFEISANDEKQLAGKDLIPIVNMVSSRINSELFSRKEPEEVKEPVKTTLPGRHSHPDKLIETIQETK